MKNTEILQADYLDIIYDNRNKEYGGYELRRHYNQRMGRAALMLFAALGMLISFSFITSHPAPRLGTNRKPVVITHIVDVVLPHTEQKLVIQPPPPPTVHAHALSVPKVVHNDDVPDPPAELPKTSGDGTAGHETVAGTATGSGTGTTITGGPVGYVGQPIVPPAKPVIWVSQMPEFRGDLNNWIGAHLRYPEVARAQGIEGKVVIQFVVNEDGTVSEARVVKGIGGGCDEEALRMVNAMPVWKPGRQNGTPVKVFFSIPIKFVLN